MGKETEAIEKVVAAEAKKVMPLMKYLIPLVLAGSVAGGGSYLGVQQAAPHAGDVKALSDSVTRLEKTLVSIDAKLSAITDGQTRDKAEMQRQIDTANRAIEKIESKLLGDHEARLRALEARIK